MHFAETRLNSHSRSFKVIYFWFIERIYDTMFGHKYEDYEDRVIVTLKIVVFDHPAVIS